MQVGSLSESIGYGSLSSFIIWFTGKSSISIFQYISTFLCISQVFTSVVQVWFIAQVWVFSISLLKQEDKDVIVINSTISFFIVLFIIF